MYNEAILKDIKDKRNKEEIVRKIYLGYPTNVFKGIEDVEFEIINNISQFFEIPYNSIQVVGSAKTGVSYFKNKKFIPKESDLDIAIINETLFLNYMQIVYKETKGYSDLSNFPSYNGSSKYNQYIKYISKGNFRPDLMPYGKYRTGWFKFFSKLSNNYYEYFSDINAGIYLNQVFFEYKQLDNIDRFMETQGGI